jgi:exodeoxyribonuclease V alpha subunit
MLSAIVTVTRVFPGMGGGAVFFGKDTGGNTLHLVANYDNISGTPSEGEIWSVRGMPEEHPKHGAQIRVESALRTRPSGRLIVEYLTKNRAFKGVGIGARKSERLWERFGEELYSILSNGEVERLSEVVTEVTARKLVDAWKNDSEEGEVLQLLANYGLDVRLANKVRLIWGKDVIRKIEENPYRMLAFGGWDKVDRAARSMGLAIDDPRRQVAAVEAFLYRRLDAKHTATPPNILLEGVKGTLGTHSKEQARSAIGRATEQFAVVECSKGYQPLGAAVMERFIAERFRAMIGRVTNQQLNLFSSCLSPVVEDTVRSFESRRGITLNNEQKSGVEMAAGCPLSLLMGGAGVGKTTVLEVVHEVSERTGTVVRQMALSGRAAQRMREATGRPATTIAKYLRECAGGVTNDLSEPLIIIDECSMLDLPLLYSIIRAMPPRARLLLVGDPYQLPPIGFGLVFQVLTASPNIPKVELKEVHRQAQSSGIPQIAHDVRRGVVPELLTFSGNMPGVSFLPVLEAEIIEYLVSVIEQLGEAEDVQILGVMKRGLSGVKSINSTFHAIHSESKRKLSRLELAEGDPIIHLANDYERELWNGTLGKIETIKFDSDNGRRATLDCVFEGIEHKFSEEGLNNIALAYAITVHKAQGSQFQRVVIPIVRSRLLDRALIYTALTRGVEQVVFIGDHRAFELAVRAQPRSNERVVGFSL